MQKMAMITIGIFLSAVEWIFALNITSKPNLVALAGRPIDHSYTYQVSTDGGSGVAFELTKAPDGMKIDGTGAIGWNPSHEQAYDNEVEVTASKGEEKATQKFKVFVHGLNSATVAQCKKLNQEFNKKFTKERPNRHLLIHIGDSQSEAKLWGNTLISASTWDQNPPHYPRWWGAYQDGGFGICDSILNGHLHQSFFRVGGHGEHWGNLTNQTSEWGLSNAGKAVANSCGGGPFATVQFGHNDASSKMPVAQYIANMEAIADTLLKNHCIPIFYTTPDAVGGSWGEPEAMALYPQYETAIVEMCRRRHIPLIDLRGALQSIVNRKSDISLGDLLHDEVHYKWESDKNPGENLLHNEKKSLNVAMHLLAHMLGYLYDSGAKSPIIGNESEFPNGLPVDEHRQEWKHTETKPTELPKIEYVKPKIGLKPSFKRNEIVISIHLASVDNYSIELSIFDLQGKRIRKTIHGQHQSEEHAIIGKWDKKDSNGNLVSQGVYYLALLVDDMQYSQKFFVGH